MPSPKVSGAWRGRWVRPLAVALALLALALAAVRELVPTNLGGWGLAVGLVAWTAAATAAGALWARHRWAGPADSNHAGAAGEQAVRPAAPEDASAHRPAPLAEDPAALAHILSHDLRAPLRVVDGFARIVQEDYGHQLDRIGHDHLNRVVAAAGRMNQMIDALLAQARLAQVPMRREPVDLSALAEAVIDDMRRAEPQRQVKVDIEPGLKVQGDPVLLRQMLENLLGNAWKYTARTEAACIALRHDPASTCGFVVSDNGAGFDMRLVGRLFGLFQRLHSASDFPGTGIGLASVQRIVQRHGGTIRAEAEVGAGARFHFTLP